MLLMDNSVYQLDWAQERPDNNTVLFLGMPGRVAQKEAGR